MFLSKITGSSHSRGAPVSSGYVTGLSSGRFESRRELARSEVGRLLSIVCMLGSMSVTCRRLAVSSGHSGFLRQ